MYKFMIEYYYEHYHTGAINRTKTRKGTVFANSRSEAVKKIKEADENAIYPANIDFEEVRSDTE